MIGVLLSILKIIGIILLCILGFIILLLLMVLFVPLRYRIKGNYKDKIPDFCIKAHYLLHMVSVSFVIKDKSKELIIRLFGIKLKLKKKKQKEEAKSKDNSEKDKPQENAEEAVAKEDKEKKASIGSILQKIKYYINIIKKDSTKKAFETVKKRLVKILKAVLPYKGKIRIYLGLENPGTTGEILGAYKALYDFIGKSVTLYPYFDREYLEVDCDIKGAVFPFRIINQLVAIYLDKNCRRLIHLFIKKKK